MKSATGNLKVISFPTREKTKQEIIFEQDMEGLTETMGELFMVAKMTGRTGLPRRVWLSIAAALQSAMMLAEEQCGKAEVLK